MRNSVTIFIVFTSAFISSILMMTTSMFSFIAHALFNRELIIMVLLLGLLLFPKKVVTTIKAINIFSWVILLSYLIGVLSMEYTTYKFSVPFEGLMITAPLLISFIYWSQKREVLQLLKHNEWSRINNFRADLLLISASFYIAGLLSLITELQNVDARGIWPFQVYFMAFYGIIFSWFYSLSGVMIRRNHIKYTLLISLIIILSYMCLSYFPSKNYLYREIKIEPFYLVFAIIFLVHLGVCTLSFMKRVHCKIPNN